MAVDRPKTLAFKATRTLITSIVEDTLEGRRDPSLWSRQGFGMLRTYLDPDSVWRLNVWHAGVAEPGVSTIHDHPWDFKSLVVAGEFFNTRFERNDDTTWPVYRVHQIQTGPGGGPSGPIQTARLSRYRPEHYRAGDVYSQQAEEVHESGYMDGTVTINERIRRPDGEHANVFWEHGEWINAVPRQATLHEVQTVLSAALVRLRHED